MESLFITGTDTGVGKTLVTALLALRLQEVTGIADEMELVCPVRFEEPLAPLVAARRAGCGSRDFMAQVVPAYQELRRRHECVLVEGVGGLLVPIQESDAELLTCVHLAGMLGLPVAVVARSALGTINHTALTCRTPLLAPSKFVGLIFCDAQPMDAGDVASATSPDVVEEMTGLPGWGRVPYLTDVSRPALQDAAERYLSF
jgi:dethiobiotin synthetase